MGPRHISKPLSQRPLLFCCCQQVLSPRCREGHENSTESYCTTVCCIVRVQVQQIAVAQGYTKLPLSNKRHLLREARGKSLMSKQISDTTNHSHLTYRYPPSAAKLVRTSNGREKVGGAIGRANISYRIVSYRIVSYRIVSANDLKQWYITCN